MTTWRNWIPTVLSAVLLIFFVVQCLIPEDGPKKDDITATNTSGDGPVTVTSRAPGATGPAVVPPYQSIHITGQLCNNTHHALDVVIEYRLRKLENGGPEYDIPYSVIGPGPLEPGCRMFDRDFSLPPAQLEPGLWALVGNIIIIDKAEAYHFATQTFRVLAMDGTPNGGH